MGDCDVAVIGLSVMGANLATNCARRGFHVAVFARRREVVDEYLAGQGKEHDTFGTNSYEELVKSLKRPRKLMMLIRAGAAVDSVIDTLLPLLEPGDIVIDGGNSHYPDTNRRTAHCKEKGVLFVGAGVSGGEEGALNGPSIMPGGNVEAWPAVKPIFQAIAAKVEDGSPCCDWVGSDGAGHFVKMVHNGIEYGDMQLICEAYQLLRDVGGLSVDEMAVVFREWNEGDLDSYLIEITGDILSKRDADGTPMVDVILDKAGQKGTGKWTAITALEQGMPTTLVAEAVFARCLSALKDERVAASKVLQFDAPAFTGDRAAFVDNVRQALFVSKVVSYAQGFQLLQSAAAEFGWSLDYGSIALMWRGGCIIRSTFLGKIKEAFDADASLQSLLLAPYFTAKVAAAQPAWRTVVGTAVAHGVPVPAMSTALSFFDGYRTARLPANLLQAQRDYFGAHTFKRVDKPDGAPEHFNWTGKGGAISSTTYNA